MIALQEMNLAFKYPIIFWNCACLISDAGGNEEEEIDEEVEEELKKEEPYYEEMEEFNEEEDEEVSSYDEDDSESGFPATIVVTKEGRKKKKVKATSYGKIATAIGKIQSSGVIVAPPDINKSSYTFSPDAERNLIRFGLSGITRISRELVKQIIANRPFKDIEDFLSKVKVNKTQMINLIKAGAFDWLSERTKVMHQYVDLISDTKKRITLQNMKMLIDFELIPEEYDLQKRVFNFNKYLKKAKNGDFYELDNIAFNFYSNCFDIDMLSPSDTSESNFKIKQSVWDTIYKKQMDIVRPFVKANQDRLLIQVNEHLTQDTWNKYCLGSLSKWEMDSISCYIHEHELAHINERVYGLSNFSEIPEQPQIEKYIPIKGKMIPIFRLWRIYGTVLDRDKAKKSVTLLTKDSVVVVKIYGPFAEYDKQISEMGADGHKHVIRKSEFSRGNKIIVTGIREEEGFRAKKYSKTPFHLVETIKSVDNGNLVIDNRNDD